MVRLPPGSFTIPTRGAAMKGQGLWKWRNGSLVYQAWPKSQPRARTQAEQDNRDLLYWSTQIVPLMDAYQQEFSFWLSANTQLVARDFLFIALFGRIGHLVRQDGKAIYSMAAMQDVSKTLDAIWQLKGGILVRGDTWWQGLAAGDPHQVLTIDPAGEIGWADAAGGGASPWFMQAGPVVPDAASGSFGANAASQFPIYCPGGTTLTGVKVWVVTPGTGNTALSQVYQAAGSNQTLQGGALLTQGAAQPLTQGLNTLPFAAPQSIASDTWLWAGLTILGSGSVNFGNLPQGNFCRYFTQTTSTLPTTAPANASGFGNNVSWWLY